MHQKRGWCNHVWRPMWIAMEWEGVLPGVGILMATNPLDNSVKVFKKECFI